MSKAKVDSGLPQRVWLPDSAVQLAAVSPELENLEGAYWVRVDSQPVAAGEQEDSVREAASEAARRIIDAFMFSVAVANNHGTLIQRPEEAKIAALILDVMGLARTPSVSPQPTEECNHCTCWPNPTCNCVRPCATCRKKAAVSLSEEEIAREIAYSVPELADVETYKLIARIAAALRSARQVKHHKNCAIWTVTLEGKSKPCDCSARAPQPPYQTYKEDAIWQAVWDVTEDFKGVLNELQRDRISVDTVTRLRASSQPAELEGER